MTPSYDPAALLALVRRKDELQIEPLPVRPEVLRVATSKAALKRWRRAYEFHKSHAEYGRKETRNGNCNS
jgi:hypothetical protein